MRIVMAALAVALLGNPALAKDWAGKVVGVSDGDTLTVFHDGFTSIIRLSQIDCPEKSQEFGKQAKLFTAAQCFGECVKVVEHGKDRYGRIVAEVITEKGVDLNKELLRSGLAWHYVQYSKDPELAGIEAQARSDQRGLWKNKDAIAPWLFRKHRK